MAYQHLHERFARIGHLDHAEAMLAWDEAAMMPAGAGAARAGALAALRTMIHEATAAPEVGELLAAAEGEDLDPWQRANARCIKRQWRRSAAVPAALATALSEARSACEQAWRVARAANDWPAVAGKLAKVVDLAREEAAALADGLGCAPYDALVGGYQHGMARAELDPLFAQLRGALPPLIQAAAAAPPPTPLPGTHSVASQEALGRALMAALGFDFERGRLGVSHHPFCGGVPDDTRITTRYNEADCLESMYAVLHETGHALYQQGLPAAWRGQPVGDACGMAVHESQSLCMEMQLCRGTPFLRFAAPIMQRELLGGSTTSAAWQSDNLAALARRVKPGFIRVDADELTYPGHVILRYELETALIDGSLAVADIPDAWDAAMQQHLGLATGNDYANGCMQDVHWFAGLIGYFPLYTVGAVMAAQIYRAASASADLDAAAERGDFEPLVGWLRANIHQRGQLLDAGALLVEATGAELDAAPFLDHLRRRYGAAG